MKSIILSVCILLIYRCQRVPENDNRQSQYQTRDFTREQRTDNQDNTYTRDTSPYNDMEAAEEHGMGSGNHDSASRNAQYRTANGKQRFVPLIERFGKNNGVNMSGIKNNPIFQITVAILITTLLVTKGLTMWMSRSDQTNINDLIETVKHSIETQNKLISRIDQIENSKNQSLAKNDPEQNTDIGEIKKALSTLSTELSQIKNQLIYKNQRGQKYPHMFSLDTTPNLGEDLDAPYVYDKAPEVAEVFKRRTINSPGQQMINVCKPLGRNKVPSVSVSPEKQRSFSPSKQFSIPHPRARTRPKPVKIVEEHDFVIDTNVVNVDSQIKYPDQIIDLPVDRAEERSDCDDERNYTAEDDNPFAVIQKCSVRKPRSPRLSMPRVAHFQPPDSFCDITNLEATSGRKSYKVLSPVGWS